MGVLVRRKKSKKRLITECSRSHAAALAMGCHFAQDESLQPLHVWMCRLESRLHEKQAKWNLAGWVLLIVDCIRMHPPTLRSMYCLLRRTCARVASTDPRPPDPMR